MEESSVVLVPFRISTPSWQQLYDHARSTTQLSDIIKAQWIEALDFLREDLTKGFFHTCGLQHPVYLKLTGVSEGQVRALIQWVKTLQLLKSGNSNYPFLLEKLRSKRKCASEAIPFIEISSRLLQQDFEVFFPREKEDTKNHDIEALYKPNQQKIFIEVAKINDTTRRNEQQKLYNHLHNETLLYGYDLPVAGQLKQYIESPDIQKHIIDVIHNLKDIAWKERRLAEYVDENIAIAFVHPDCMDALECWSQEHRVRKGFNGLEIEFDDTSRIIRQSRIKEEANQIPEGQPGLLYFPIQLLYMLTMDRAAATAKFSIALSAFPNIIGIVMYAEVWPAPEAPFEMTTPYFTTLSVNEAGVGRYTLFVENPFFNITLGEGVIEKLKKAMV